MNKMITEVYTFIFDISSPLKMRTNKESTNHIIQITLNSILFCKIVFCDTKESSLQEYCINFSPILPCKKLS